jgi:hypothetical protein
VRAGILKVNEYRQVWTKRSVDAIKEQRNYRYIQKDDGTFTEKPMDDFDHAMSARRYAVISKHLQIMDKVRLLVHADSIEESVIKLGGLYEVFNGFSISETKAHVVTCQWDRDGGRLHVNYEAAMDTIDDIERYVNSTKKARNVCTADMNSVAAKNVVAELMRKKVSMIVNESYDPVGSLYFLNAAIDNKLFTVNPMCRGLLLAMQNDVEVKQLSPHVEALLYVVNNIYLKRKMEDTRKPLKPFTKEKYEYQQQQEEILKGVTKKVENYSPGWQA